MSALAPRLLSGLARPARGVVHTPRANLYARPAREPLSLLDKSIALATCFVSLLGPPGWVLANLESYKAKA